MLISSRTAAAIISWTTTLDDETWYPHNVWSYHVKARAGWHCEGEGCGVPVESPNAHARHINGKGLKSVAEHGIEGGDNRLSNGQCLCAFCHMSPIGKASGEAAKRWAATPEGIEQHRAAGASWTPERRAARSAHYQRLREDSTSTKQETA